MFTRCSIVAFLTAVSSVFVKYEGSTVDCFIFFSFLENWVDEGYVYVFMSLVPSDYWLTKLLNVKEFF